MSNSDWPQPEEWYVAVVSRADKGTLTLNVTLTNGDEIQVWNSRITQALGGHVICIPLSTEAAVRLFRHPRTGALHCEECRLLGDESRPESTEALVIYSWNDERGFGTGIRPCGCPVFTVGRRGLTLQDGDVVQAKLRDSDKKPGLMAAFALTKS